MFSPETRHWFANARGFGHLEAPTHEATTGDPAQGHFFQLQLQVDLSTQTVNDLSFYCPRCLPAIACGAYLHDFLLHQPLSRARQLSTDQVLLALGGLPVQRSFYAWMAVQAVHDALGKEEP